MIAADVRLREELALCHGFGIPHSEFLSWRDDDQDKALAYAAFDRSICGGCGTRPAEWEADRHAYSAAVHSCPGCRETGAMKRAMERAGVEPGEFPVLIPKAEARRRAVAKGEAQAAARAARMAGAEA